MNLNERAQGTMTPRLVQFAGAVTWFCLLACILLLVFTFYRAEITHQWKMPERYSRYYLFSLAGICFWGAVTRLADRTKLRIVVATSSLVVGLLLAEMSLSFMALRLHQRRGNDFVANRVAAAKAAGLEFDTRSKFQVYQDLRSGGTDAVPAIHPSFFINTNGVPGAKPLFPFGGVSLKTTVYCNESGKRAVFLSDRYGFNNPDSEWNLSQTEWVITGDSYAQGACVDPGEDIGGQIRLMTGEGVINLGSGGNGPLVELAALKEYAESRRPKIVLWLYCEVNDPDDLVREKSAPLLLDYLRPGFSQNLIHRQTEIDIRLLKFLAEAEKDEGTESQPENVLKRMASILHLPNVRQRLRFSVSDPHVDPLFFDVLKEARDRIAAWVENYTLSTYPTTNDTRRKGFRTENST